MPRISSSCIGPVPDLQAIKADAQGETGARTDARLGSGGAEDRVGTRDLVRNTRLRRRRDVDGRQSGVSGPRQRRAVGLCGRHRQGAQGDQDRQPHHGGAHDLRGQRRAVRRRASRATAAPRSRWARSRRAAPRSNIRTPIASSPSSSAAARCRRRRRASKRRSPSRPSRPPTQAQIDAGEVKFVEECSRCHAARAEQHARSAQAQRRLACRIQGHRAERSAGAGRAWSASTTS